MMQEEGGAAEVEYDFGTIKDPVLSLKGGGRKKSEWGHKWKGPSSTKCSARGYKGNKARRRKAGEGYEWGVVRGGRGGGGGGEISNLTLRMSNS